MAVQLSPLQLEAYYVREFSFRTKPGLDEQRTFQMQLGVGLQLDGLLNPDPLTVTVRAAAAGHKEDPNRWKCLVSVDSDNPPDRQYPYEFHAVLIGYFVVHEQVPPEAIETIVKVNGSSVLYSAARELIAGATGRGAFPHVLLQTVIFTPEDEPEQKQLPVPEENEGAEVKRAPKKKVSKKGAKKKKR